MSTEAGAIQYALTHLTTSQIITSLDIFVQLRQYTAGYAILADNQNNHGTGDTGGVRCRRLND